MKFEPGLAALALGAFGIGVTEFAPMGLLPAMAADLHVSIPAAGLLISAYALGVMVGAPLMSIASGQVQRRALLIGLAAIFTVGNMMAALSGSYATLLLARIVTSLNHGAFFGIGSVVAAGLVSPGRRSSAVATMFMGLTIANVAGVPLAAWAGEHLGWRASFWGISALGIATILALRLALPPLPAPAGTNMATELRVLMRRPVLGALALTVMGSSAMFTVFTYIAPILRSETQASLGFVTAMLVTYGLGLTAGNWLGGRFADRSVDRTLMTALGALAAILVAFSLSMASPVAVPALVFLWGVASFALVPPLQSRVLAASADAPNLAATVNIGAFNLGNALGAALGGSVIAAGLGYLAIFWYDPASGRIRSASTRTTCQREGCDALDRHYLQNTTGHAICPTCGQQRNERPDYFVTDAIADYLLKKQDKTLNARLAHIVQYISTLSSPAIYCWQVDEDWVEDFRKWAAKQPVMLTSGQSREKPRADSTIENSLIQLAAAINAAHRRGDIIKGPQFRPIPTTQLNQTPSRRLTVAELAQAFAYSTDPQYPHKRANLHAFLIAAVSTAARPDAVYEISTAAERGQWLPTFGVLELNPKGRRQTKKYRPSLKVPRQFAALLEKTNGYFIPVKSVGTAFDQMAPRSVGLRTARMASNPFAGLSHSFFATRRGVCQWNSSKSFSGIDGSIQRPTSMHLSIRPTYESARRLWKASLTRSKPSCLRHFTGETPEHSRTLTMAKKRPSNRKAPETVRFTGACHGGRGKD